MDISFTYSSIERLVDLMLREPSVGGAACRVFAEGSGPVIWYQIYEYAIWHWLVKVNRQSFKLNCSNLDECMVMTVAWKSCWKTHLGGSYSPVLSWVQIFF